jgi:hypothetical protein
VCGEGGGVSFSSCFFREKKIRLLHVVKGEEGETEGRNSVGEI